LFPGTTTDDLYRAIVRGQTQASGTRWRVTNFVEIGVYRLRERWRHRRGQVLPAPAEESPFAWRLEIGDSDAANNL
jgi:hypothetical protein